VTERDTLDLVLREFGEPDVYDRAEAELGRSLSLHEVIALEFGSVRAPLVDVAAWIVENAAVRRGFKELAEAHRPVVVSSGFHELIEPLLAREGVDVEVLANRLDPRPEGWRVLFRDEAACATCGEACKRGSLPADGEVVYVGDGYSDRCAALAADRVFARDGLARYLEQQGVSYEPFTDFVELRRRLG
jgi:2-hydroxy-3-keto-5-methylthiopentenyl-1-phosphate phosphatase